MKCQTPRLFSIACSRCKPTAVPCCCLVASLPQHTTADNDVAAPCHDHDDFPFFGKFIEIPESRVCIVVIITFPFARMHDDHHKR